MIHFRYHLLTLVSVFLALGVGILLGGTAGHSWFALGEQEVLTRMEAKYDQALKSNNDLKQQMNRMLKEIEQSNQDVIHLMAMRYANELQGSKVYFWHAPELNLERISQVMNSVGIELVPYQEKVALTDAPLLLFAPTKPEWLDQISEKSRWLHVEQVPLTPASQWELLEKVQKLLTEMRIEHEKS